MADEADLAQREIERSLDRSLEAHRQAMQGQTPSARCVDCGDEIPLARQLAVITSLCIDCATDRARRRP